MPIASSLRRPRIDADQPAVPQVFEALRAAIVGLELEPGALINRAALQSRFRLSSTPIRDALIRLADEGLVEIVPQSATRVSLIDVAQAQQTQFLRRSLELEVVATLCGAMDKSVVAVLREGIAAQKAAARAGDLVGFERLDLAFHQRMYEAAGVAELYALVRSRSGHIDRLRRLHLPVAGRVQEIVRDHAGIIKAIAAGDVAAAQRTVRDHLSRSLAYSPALREKRPDYFTA
jgi:DNA-binding GntR family transcriptional regulator